MEGGNRNAINARTAVISTWNTTPCFSEYVVCSFQTAPIAHIRDESAVSLLQCTEGEKGGDSTQAAM